GRANERRVYAATAVAALDAPISPVSDDGDGVITLPSSIRRGGTALGRAVHAVLATVDLTDAHDLDGFAREQAAREGVHGWDYVARRARSALASPTVLAARSAGRRWRELYVA